MPQTQIHVPTRFANTRRLVASALLLAATAAMSACLISSNESEAFTGKRVSSATYNQIEPGTTTKSWIMGTLGEPTSKQTLENSEELWKWSYTQTKTSHGAVLFIFGGSTTKATAGSVYVQFKGDTVTKTWRTDG